MKKVDSSVLAMDCHALQSKARNDGKTQKAENVFSNQTTRRKDLPMILGAFKAGGKGAY